MKDKTGKDFEVGDRVSFVINVGTGSGKMANGKVLYILPYKQIRSLNKETATILREGEGHYRTYVRFGEYIEVIPC